jgi:coenzyme F420 hydrogenase subunit beta
VTGQRKRFTPSFYIGIKTYRTDRAKKSSTEEKVGISLLDYQVETFQFREAGRMKSRDFSQLHRKVIKRGLCTGCGTCIGVCSTGAIRFDFDLEEPVLTGTCAHCGICYDTCPGEDIPLLKLEQRFFGESRKKENELLGISKAFLKGYSIDTAIRQLGASGGLTTTLLLYALDQGMIEGAIVSIMDHQKPWRVRSAFAKTKEELIEGAKSKYAISPNNMSLKDSAGVSRLAVVGLPCHIHGIRKVQSQKDLSKIADNIVLTLGIFCGANQSYKATEHVIQENSDISLEEIERFEYRGGVNAQNINIIARNGKEITIENDVRRAFSHYIMKERCRMCCDFSAELADLSLGDILDPRRNKRVPNWTGLIVRSEKGLRLIDDAQKAGVIEISPLDEESFYGNKGFECKKHGAVYNLGMRKRYGWPVPNYHYEFTWQARRRKPYSVPGD